MKNTISTIFFTGAVLLLIPQNSCRPPQNTLRIENKKTPEKYFMQSYSSNAAQLSWRQYFADKNLEALIDSALSNNQELNIILQEIEISKNEIKARKGEYLPFVHATGGSGLEKPGHYTKQGVVEKQLDVLPGKKFPEPSGDFMLGASATWEIDVWKKLRNAKFAAQKRFLATTEGKNFMVTKLVAEIADAYYELMALDNLLNIIEKNIETQQNALKVVKQQKESARVTQLAINRFEAQLLNTENLKYAVRQKITETENRLNLLCGRFPSPIKRSSVDFLQMPVDSIQAGLPSQLLENRPDIKQAEYELEAAKLDVKVARANFFPSFTMNAGSGFQAFSAIYLFKPQSVLYNAAGDVVAPLINRNAIKAAYRNASARQIQAVYNYEQKIINAYADVLNQLAKVENYTNSFQTKQRQVELLMESISVANTLFNSARADYGEVLFTQREALEAKMDLVEVKLKQMNAKVNLYRALGGGWR